MGWNTWSLHALFSIPRKETVRTMATEYRIPHLIEPSRISGTIAEWVTQLTELSPLQGRKTDGWAPPPTNTELAVVQKRVREGLSLAQRLVQDLEGCKVIKIQHWRRGPESSSAPHECIVLSIQSRGDHRFMRLDRRKKAANPNSDESSLDIKQTSRGSLGINTGNSDSVAISDIEGDLLRQDRSGTPYKLVQSVSIPPRSPDPMTILDCIALAQTITDAAKNYSVMHHMCMWWAAVFFKAACIRFDLQDVARHEAYSSAGKICGIPFLTRDATPTFRAASRDKAIQNQAKLDADFASSLESDAAQSEDSGRKLSPVEQIVSKARERRMVLDKKLADQVKEYAEMEDALEAQGDKTDKAEARAAKAEAKAADLAATVARQNEEIAALRRQIQQRSS